jgi:hypothetical protein
MRGHLGQLVPQHDVYLTWSSLGEVDLEQSLSTLFIIPVCLHFELQEQQEVA